MVPAVRGSNRWLVEPTGMFHRTITQRRALVRQSKSNSNTKPKRKIPGEGDKPVSLLKRTRVPKRAFRGEKCCANGLDKADFLIDGLFVMTPASQARNHVTKRWFPYVYSRNTNTPEYPPKSPASR